jgi:hypothetical protein
VANTQEHVVLFKTKSGAVHASVTGPRIGFRWTQTNYYRWMPSTKEAGEWQRRTDFREQDQEHLERCVKAVRHWFSER